MEVANNVEESADVDGDDSGDGDGDGDVGEKREEIATKRPIIQLSQSMER